MYYGPDGSDDDDYPRSRGTLKRGRWHNRRGDQDDCCSVGNYAGHVVALVGLAAALVAVTSMESSTPLRNSTCADSAKLIKGTTLAIVALVIVVLVIAIVAATQKFFIKCRTLCYEDNGNRIVPSMAATTLLIAGTLVTAQHFCNHVEWHLHWLSLLSIVLAAFAVVIYTCA